MEADYRNIEDTTWWGRIKNNMMVSDMSTKGWIVYTVCILGMFAAIVYVFAIII